MNNAVKICTKCGRGIIGERSINAPHDKQPVWWTSGETGPMCNGRLAWVARDAQVSMLDKED